jgi:hypothetical protein
LFSALVSRHRSCDPLGMRIVVLTSLACLALGCGGSSPAPSSPAPPTATAPAETPAASATPKATPTTATREGAPAHKLLVAAAACWFGGTWSDAEGADTPDARKAASEARCHDFNGRVYGADDKEHYEQLRALEANAVDAVKQKIEDLAKVDDTAHKDALSKIAVALAAA